MAAQPHRAIAQPTQPAFVKAARSRFKWCVLGVRNRKSFTKTI